MPLIDRSLNYGRHIIAGFLSEIRPYKSVVDLGAGHGDDLETARALESSAQVFAVETFPPYISELEEKGIQTLSLNIERDILPFSDESLDVVITNQVLEHTKEIFWISHEITRVLRVGGHWIIGVPNLASFHNRILLFLGKQPTSLRNFSAHVRGFTRADILDGRNSVFPNGYRPKSIRGSNFYPFPPLIACYLAFLFPYLAWGIFLLLQKERMYNGEFLIYPNEKKLETNFWLGVA